MKGHWVLALVVPSPESSRPLNHRQSWHALWNPVSSCLVVNLPLYLWVARLAGPPAGARAPSAALARFGRVQGLRGAGSSVPRLHERAPEAAPYSPYSRVVIRPDRGQRGDPSASNKPKKLLGLVMTSSNNSRQRRAFDSRRLQFSFKYLGQFLPSVEVQGSPAFVSLS
jgi:hypothetical protein